ncbi:MAG: hypothetical protein WCC59_10790 [Terriglobales bacterium]
MKLKSILSVALLVSCAAPLLAAVKQSVNVTLDQPLKVAATELKRGDYKVEWQGAGPQVEVTFLQHGKVIATSSAKLQANHSPYEEGIESQVAPDNTKVLEKVYAKHQELAFLPGTAVAK